MPTYLERLADESGQHEEYVFWCPGCNTGHSFCVKRDDPKDIGPVWSWNGSVDKPTFNPSLLVWGSRPDKRCHLFLHDGRIQYLDDCSHALKGTTIDLVDYDSLME